MKKILLIMLSVFLLASLASCGGNKTGVDNTEPSGNEAVSGEVSTTELSAEAFTDATIKGILAKLPPEELGLTHNLNEYVFKASVVTFNGEKSCKAAAHYMSAEPEAVFYIVGTVCYKYDAAENKYYRIDDKKSVEVKAEVVEPTTSTEDTTSYTTRTKDDVDDENTKVLRARYANYDLSVVGLPKPITEYTFQATASSATAVNGERVYIIYLLENGAYTDFVFAVDANGNDYYYDPAADQYKKLS